MATQWPANQELLCFIADLEDALTGTEGLDRFKDLCKRYDLDENYNVDYYRRGYWHGPGMKNFREYAESLGEPIPNA